MITNRVGRVAPPYRNFLDLNRNMFDTNRIARPTDSKFDLYHHDCSFFRAVITGNTLGINLEVVKIIARYCMILLA